MKILNLITKNHKKTKRKFIERIVDNKIEAMRVARLYEYDYWDSKRRYGFGGYNYIQDYWTPVAKKLIKNGADVLVSGSHIFKDTDPIKKISDLKNII